MSLCNCRHRLCGKPKCTEDNMLESIASYMELELKEDDQDEDVEIGSAQLDSRMVKRFALFDI